MEDDRVDTSRAHLEQFLQSLTEFKTPVETISELAKHEKVDGRGSWTEAEMESELLYGVQLYLTHLGCPLEYRIPCSRAVVNDILDGSFRVEDFETSPPQLVKIENSNGEEDLTANGENGHGNGHAEASVEEKINGDGIQKEKVTVLSAKNLYQHAIVKANELLARWKNDVPNIEPVRLPHAISVHAMKNKRPGMEDRYVVIPDLRAVVDVKGIKSPVSFYAVYDGHAGTVAATYAAAHLHQRLCGSRSYPDQMEDALREAFVSTDDFYMEKGVRDRDSSGTTAVVSIIHEKKLFVAWVGDSEAAIVHDGQADRLVEPRHTAEHEGERKRVESEGGSVIHHQGGYRVAAVLTVTRAIGDSGLKPFVTSKPDVRVIDLTGAEDYLILGCDGLWDEMTPESAMKETDAFLLNNPESVDGVAKILADKARKSGSLDNITVIVVFLKPFEKLLEEIQSRSTQISQNSENISSFANSSDSHEDDFAEFPVEFDPSAQNPFDTTPLDSSVLGDFGTPSDRSASEIDWDFQRIPPLNFHEEESHALNVLDQVIEGAAVTDSPAPNQELINFDNFSNGFSQNSNQNSHSEFLQKQEISGDGQKPNEASGGKNDFFSGDSDVARLHSDLAGLHSSPEKSGNLLENSEKNSNDQIGEARDVNETRGLDQIASSNDSDNLQSSEQVGGGGGIPSTLNEKSEKTGVEGVSNGIQQMNLRSEPNSGSEPLPSLNSVLGASSAEKADPKKNAGRLPTGKSPVPAKNLKVEDKTKSATKSPATSGSTPKQTKTTSTPRGTPITTTKPSPNSSLKNAVEAKKTPQVAPQSGSHAAPQVAPQAGSHAAPQVAPRKPTTATTPVQKTDLKTPRTNPAELAKKSPVLSSSGPPKSAKSPATKTDGPVAPTASAAAVAGSSRPLASASRTPPTRTPPTTKSAVSSSKSKGTSPDGVVDAADKSKPLPATPRNTPVAQKRPAMSGKPTSAGVTSAVTEKAHPLGEASTSTNPVKTNGGLSTARSVDVKKATVASSRTATPAVKARPAATHLGLEKKTVTEGAALKGVVASNHNSGATSAETPKSKLTTGSDDVMKTPAVPPLRQKPVATPTPRTTVGTPRPKPATDGVHSAAARSKPNGVERTGTASTPGRMAPKKGVTNAAKTNVDKKVSVPPTASTTNGEHPSAPPTATTTNGDGKSSKNPEVAEFFLTSTDSNGAVETVVLNGNGEIHEAGHSDNAGLSEPHFGVAESSRNDENAISL